MILQNWDFIQIEIMMRKALVDVIVKKCQSNQYLQIYRGLKSNANFSYTFFCKSQAQPYLSSSKTYRSKITFHQSLAAGKLVVHIAQKFSNSAWETLYCIWIYFQCVLLPVNAMQNNYRTLNGTPTLMKPTLHTVPCSKSGPCLFLAALWFFGSHL